MIRPDSAWLEAMYNNRARVPGHDVHFRRWAEVSGQVKASQPCMLDIAYGPSEGQKLDVFPAPASGGRGSQVLVFIHGGYWRSLDKAEQYIRSHHVDSHSWWQVHPYEVDSDGVDDGEAVCYYSYRGTRLKAAPMSRSIAAFRRHAARHPEFYPPQPPN